MRGGDKLTWIYRSGLDAMDVRRPPPIKCKDRVGVLEGNER